MGYCTRGDLYKYGLQRGLLSQQGRLVASSLSGTDTIELDGHGLETDDEVVFRAEDGGTLSAPLVAGTTYYAIRINESHFKVAAAPAGAAINLTTDGVSMLVGCPLPYDEVIEFYSAFVDGCVPHAVPFTSPVPVLVRGIVAELSAKKLLMLAGQTSIALDDAVKAAREQLKEWGRGVPIRDANVTASANRAIVSSLVSSGGDPRGWGSGSLP